MRDAFNFSHTLIGSLSAGAGRHLSDIIEGAGHPPRLCWEGKLELTEPLRSADRTAKELQKGARRDE